MALLELAGAALAAGLVGSPHCAGMCGGFVCFVGGDATGPRRWGALAAYNLGRLLSYVTLGLIAGGIGHGLERAGAAAGLGRTAAVAAGALLVLWGGAGLVRALARGAAPRTTVPALGRPLAAVVRGMRDWPPAARGGAIGLVTTLIPCGLLYGFVAAAAGTGSPAAGAVVMAAFWAGTVPMLAGLGVLARGVFGPLRDRLPVVTAALLIALGLLTLAGRLRPPEMHAHHAASPAADPAPPPAAPAAPGAPAPSHVHH